MTRGSVLVIDDEPSFGRFVGNVSKRLDLDVRVTTNADQFKKMYEASPPEVIVMDMVMPKVDGIELIGWLAEQSCRSRVVVISGYNPDYSGFAKALGRSKGLNDVITLAKPVSVADLREALVGPPG